MTELEVIGSQILIFHSGGAQIRRHISYVVLAKKDNNAFGFFTLHSSLFVLHLNMLLAKAVGDNFYNYSNYRETKASPRGRFGGALIFPSLPPYTSVRDWLFSV